MNKVELVYHSIIKWKLSNEKAAERCDLSLHEYIIIKNKILEVLEPLKDTVSDHIKRIIIESISLDECSTKSKLKIDAALSNVKIENKVLNVHSDLESGKMKLEAMSIKEPKSADEIIDLLKIDTKKWKLSQYWNKEKTGYWLVSALVTQINKEEADLLNFFDVLKGYEFPEVKSYRTAAASRNQESRACAVLSLQDLHFGKPGNENMTSVMLEVVNDLFARASVGFSLDRVVLVIGGDCLNADTFNNTTTKGTQVEYSVSAQDAYIQAFEGLYILLELLRDYCDSVNVVFIPGNHDRLSSFHLVHALSKAFSKIPEYHFYADYSERKVLVYGDNMFCFEHGDVGKKITPLVYATEYPLEWGQTTYRTLFTGHLHQKRTTEYVSDNEVLGFTTKILPSLSATDYWHYHNKFVGNKRAAVLNIYDREEGMVAEFNRNYKL